LKLHFTETAGRKGRGSGEERRGERGGIGGVEY